MTEFIKSRKSLATTVANLLKMCGCMVSLSIDPNTGEGNIAVNSPISSVLEAINKTGLRFSKELNAWTKDGKPVTITVLLGLTEKVTTD